MLLGPIQMHQSVFNSHALFENTTQGPHSDFDNLASIASSVPHIYYCNRTIKQEIIRDSDPSATRIVDSQNPGVPDTNPFPFFNKSRFSATAYGTSATNMYSMKKAGLVWPGAPESGVHGKSAQGVGGIPGGGVSSGLGNAPPTSTGRPVSPNSGLVHWVSMMADHGHVPSPAHSGPPHSDPHPHYMWNGTLEPKMSSNENQHNSMGKGPNNVDETRSGSSGLDSSPSMHHNLYGSRTNANSSPGPGHQSLLVVPQPVKTSMTNPATTNGTGRKYQCKMCPQIFGSKADMQLHTQIHMREAKPYKCSQCSKAFANSSYLSQHTRIHLGIKPYRCEMCQRKFTQLSHLQQHIRTHTGDKPYKCRHPGCNKAFSQLSNLQSHSRCHQTDKPYKCNSCYKCFVDETSLLEHIPKHKESKHLKTHICQFCGKSYTQETYLAKHMQKHADRMDKRSSALLARTHASEAYGWSTKGQPSGAGASDCQDIQSHHHHHHHHHQSDHSGNSCLGGSVLNTGTSEQSSRYSRGEMDHHRHNPQAGHGMTGGSSNGRSSEDLLYNVDQKPVSSASAFTPIQSASMLSSATAARNAVAAYFPYDSFGFKPTPSGGVPGMEMKSGMEGKAGHSSFPNQLIALHQIRNYASMPSAASSLTGEHPISLKDKTSQ